MAPIADAVIPGLEAQRLDLRTCPLEHHCVVCGRLALDIHKHYPRRSKNLGNAVRLAICGENFYVRCRACAKKNLVPDAGEWIAWSDVPRDSGLHILEYGKAMYEGKKVFFEQ
jgi:hypothetical protein